MNILPLVKMLHVFSFNKMAALAFKKIQRSSIQKLLLLSLSQVIVLFFTAHT